MSVDDNNIRDRIAMNDVTVARSYLEVDFMEWFSDNQIPFGYEAFTIPSVVGPSQDEWEQMVQAIRAIGRGDEQSYNQFSQGTRWEDMSAFEVRTMWGDIYDKHALQEEDVTVPVQDSLSNFQKELIVPDFTIYKGVQDQVVPEGFDWSSWDNIVEVSGLWGVGLPGESDEDDWWDWYRVGGVAFKEFVYKLLNLWDDVIWLIPNSPDVTRSIRDDDNYVVFDGDEAEPSLGPLYRELGLVDSDIKEFQNRLSPAIDLKKYDRDLDNNVIEKENFIYTGVNIGNIDENGNAVSTPEGWVVYYGELGEIYIGPNSVHVRESQWRNTNMIMIQEYITDKMSELSSDGIVEGLREIA